MTTSLKDSMDIAVADEQELNKPTIIIVAGLLSVCAHAILLVVTHFFDDSVPQIDGNEQRPSLKITIAARPHVKLKPGSSSLVKKDILIKQTTDDTSSTPPVDKPLQKKVEDKIRTAKPTPKTVVQDTSETLPERQNRSKVLTPADIKQLSRSAYNVSSDTNKFSENSPTVTGSGTIFSPTFRKKVQNAKSYTRGREETIESLNNRWTSNAEVVSAGGRCFEKRQIVPTSETMYYRTKCVGQKTKSETMAESLVEAMKSRK